MEDADLELLGDRKAGPFHFFLREYKKQLVAGFSKNTPTDGLIVHMELWSPLTRGETRSQVCVLL
jgi:hypothetical protein